MPAFIPTSSQLERLARSTAILVCKQIPRYSGPLYSCDESEVVLRSAKEVARRALVLWAIALRADGMPQHEALSMLDQWHLWNYVSPKETDYIRDSHPNPNVTASYVWRLESLWVLMWAIGRIEDLGWPAKMCDVPRLVKLMKPVETDPAFMNTAELRSKSVILDAQDLTMRVHWTIRDAWINKRLIRSDLNWAAGPPDVPVTQSAAVGVIEQRHHTLNWLTCFSKGEWDEVDTPT